jgi:hypothetical protein
LFENGIRIVKGRFEHDFTRKINSYFRIQAHIQGLNLFFDHKKMKVPKIVVFLLLRADRCRGRDLDTSFLVKILCLEE